MRRLTLLLLLAALVLAVAACGGDSDSGSTTAPPQATGTSAAGGDALTQVCSARDDISQEIETLRGLSPNAAGLAQATASLKAIGDDLQQIGDAAPSLSADRRSEIEAAKNQFADSVKSAAGDLTSALTSGDVQSTLTQVADELASSSKDAFAKIDCPSG